MVLPGSQSIFWWGHQTATTSVVSSSPLSCLKRGIQPSESYSNYNWSPLYYLCALAFVWHPPWKYLKLWSGKHCSLCLVSQVAHIFGKKYKSLCFHDMDLSISLCHKQLCLTVLGRTSLSSKWLHESILRGKNKEFCCVLVPVLWRVWVSFCWLFSHQWYLALKSWSSYWK